MVAIVVDRKKILGKLLSYIWRKNFRFLTITIKGNSYPLPKSIKFIFLLYFLPHFAEFQFCLNFGLDSFNILDSCYTLSGVLDVVFFSPTFPSHPLSLSCVCSIFLLISTFFLPSFLLCLPQFNFSLTSLLKLFFLRSKMTSYFHK